MVFCELVGGTLWLAVPPLVEQVRTAVEALPTDLVGVEERAEAVAEQFGLDVTVDGTAVQQWIVDNRDALLGSLTGVGAVAAGALGAAAGAAWGAGAMAWVMGIGIMWPHSSPPSPRRRMTRSFPF